MNRSYQIATLTFLAIINFAILSPLKAEFNSDLIQKVKNSVVSINMNVVESSYHEPGQFYATGFLIDREQGIILTNKHVATISKIASYRVRFFDGKKVIGQFLYSDPWHDFSFLKIDPESIPENVSVLPMSDKKPNLDEIILMVGNNGGDDFSIQSGRISSLNVSLGYFPAECMRISLNSKGGSSGSPIVNDKGEVVAINFAKDDISAFALPIDYIRDAYHVLKEGEIVPRFHNGMQLEYYSLDSAVRNSDLPEDVAEEFSQAHPESFNQILRVQSILPGSPAEKTLEVGDILWSIDGKDIGTSLYKAGKIMNEKGQSSVKIVVYRGKDRLEIETGLYDLQKNIQQRFVKFAGITFYEMDDFIRGLSGASEEGVYATLFYAKRSFSIGERVSGTFTLAKITKLSGHKINNLDDLIKIIPELVKKQYFTAAYHSFTPTYGYNEIAYVTRAEQIVDAEYSPYQEQPVEYYYDREKKEWTKKMIEIKAVAENQ